MLIFYFIASIQTLTSRQALFYFVLGIFFTIIGLLITGRHLWLLQLPKDAIPDCTPDFTYLIKTVPWREAFLIIFKSSGECAQNQGSFLGLSLPGWTFLAFIGYFLANAWGIFQLKKKKNRNSENVLI